MKLSGYTMVRNGIRLDYPFQLTILSLLKVCDEVVVSDSESDDGTRDILEALAELYEPRLRIVDYKWRNPKGQSSWFTDWINDTREQLQFPMQLELDCDEVLDDTPECYHSIRGAVEEMACRKFDRLNFWRDPKSLIPDGHCCGKYVTRLGPSALWMPSDEPRHPGECPILDKAIWHPSLRIFHLGFIRSRSAFFAKAKVVLEAFFNRYDTRLEEAEKAGKPLHESECDFTHLLQPYSGGYPAGVKEWLRERGYKV